MHRIAFCLVFSTTLALSGCFPLSTSPLFGEADRVFLPQLVGTWVEEDSEESWTFSRRDPSSYRLELRGEEGRAAFFTARLARIEETLLLDLFPAEPHQDSLDEVTAMHLLRLHSFAVVHQIEPRLKMSFLQQSWIEECLQRHPGDLPALKRGDRLILTASTAQLQRFVIRHLRSEGAFSMPKS